MPGKTITGTFAAGYVLTNADTNPVVIVAGATIGNTGSSALTANFAYNWSIQNAGLIQVVSGTAGAAGIALGAASITNTTSGRIAGFSAGISVSGAGTVSNQGTITSSLNIGSGTATARSTTPRRSCPPPSYWATARSPTRPAPCPTPRPARSAGTGFGPRGVTATRSHA